VGFISVFFGVVVHLSLLLPGFVPSKSMDQMPGILAALIGLFLIVGGGLALLGLYWRGDVVSLGWRLERSGWVLAAGGFFTYAMSVAWHYPGSLFAYGIPLLLGVGCVFRAWSVLKIEAGVRRVVNEVRGDDQ